MPDISSPSTQRPRLVQIQRNAGTQDSFGTVSNNWSTIAKAWVIQWETPKTNAGKEFFAAFQIKAQLTEILTIRWMSSITISPKDRVVYGNRKLDINAVVNVGEQNQWLQLFCQEAT